jgi:ribonuclease BN (tRNA processing enzyme)
MRVKISGTRGEIKIRRPLHDNHSGILIDKTILCDIGEKKYLRYNPKFILITHLHPDHAFFISEKDTIDIDIPVFAPEKSVKLKNIKVLSKPFIQNDYKITPIPTIHSLKVKSQGYLIEKMNKKIFYTGDIIGIKKRFHHRLQKLDAVITEASFFRKGGIVRMNNRGRKFGHAGVPDLVDFFKRFTHHIIFTHFGTWFLKDPQAAEKKIKALEKNEIILDIAYDGKVFDI